jgi:hypothetical protein
VGDALTRLVSIGIWGLKLNTTPAGDALTKLVSIEVNFFRTAVPANLEYGQPTPHIGEITLHTIMLQKVAKCGNHPLFIITLSAK